MLVHSAPNQQIPHGRGRDHLEEDIKGSIESGVA
jgi:hypothetical protein